MNLSGIVVATRPEFTDIVVDSLQRLADIDVTHIEPDTGRIIVVMEAADIEKEIEGIKVIKALPHVSMAEMVYHYFADDDQLISQPPADFNDFAPIDDSVLQRLGGSAS